MIRLSDAQGAFSGWKTDRTQAYRDDSLSFAGGEHHSLHVVFPVILIVLCAGKILLNHDGLLLVTWGLVLLKSCKWQRGWESLYPNPSLIKHPFGLIRILTRVLDSVSPVRQLLAGHYRHPNPPHPYYTEYVCR